MHPGLLAGCCVFRLEGNRQSYDAKYWSPLSVKIPTAASTPFVRLN
ncbi:hypothetical protein AWT69_004188 [Pseudomonas putida]|nr:hypothetical protein AWT69_004188 [Pseudomonas putida]